MTEMTQGTVEGVKSLYGLPTELHDIKVLIDGEVFAEFKVDPKRGGKFTCLVKDYLEDPDAKWYRRI